jgi:hypothetical protein
MNISKKRNKSVGKKIKNKSKNATIKNKSGLRKCETFCKNDYTLEMERVSREFYKKNSKTPYNPSKLTREINYNACKKNFAMKNVKEFLMINNNN